MINNFDQIIDLLTFNNENEFYFVQILKRKKEHPELGNNSYCVKTYYIKNKNHFLKDITEMICLADFHNARVYINLNKRNFERITYHTLKKITDQIMNKNFSQTKSAFNSVCGEYSIGDKTWIVDIDSKGREANSVLKTIDSCQPNGNKLIAIINTKNGVHLITKPFNMEQFKKVHSDIDVHKNNPTILYIP